MISIEEASAPDAVKDVAVLFAEYQTALGVDLSFQGFDEEVASLPGGYARPRGRLLLARADDRAVGCIGLRPLSSTDGEIKRLYVAPEARGLSLGRRLAERAIAEARIVGYERLLLDTLPSMRAAHALYRSLGFREVPPYRYNPIAGTQYFGLEL
jgi:putative acetyltransferase